jgi:hypothetical protein
VHDTKASLPFSVRGIAAKGCDTRRDEKIAKPCQYGLCIVGLDLDQCATMSYSVNSNL